MHKITPSGLALTQSSDLGCRRSLGWVMTHDGLPADLYQFSHFWQLFTCTKFLAWQYTDTCRLHWLGRRCESLQLNCLARLANNPWSVQSSVTSQC